MMMTFSRSKNWGIRFSPTPTFHKYWSTSHTKVWKWLHLEVFSQVIWCKGIVLSEAHCRPCFSALAHPGTYSRISHTCHSLNVCEGSRELLEKSVSEFHMLPFKITYTANLLSLHVKRGFFFWAKVANSMYVLKLCWFLCHHYFQRVCNWSIRL